MQRDLQKLSWITIKKLVPAEIDTAILPVGTVEAHGSACVGTDNIIPETIAAGVAGRLNALVAPTVNYGITKSLYRYPGGFTIKPDTFRAYLRDILDSLADTGFKNVFVMNGHGGNNSDLKAVAYEYHQQRQANVAVIHWWELCDEMTQQFFGNAGGHAGSNETAMVIAVDPQLADEEQYEPDLAYHFQPGADVYPVPGSVLLYKKDEGYPEFNIERARQYREKVIEVVGDFSAMVLERWRKFGL